MSFFDQSEILDILQLAVAALAAAIGALWRHLLKVSRQCDADRDRLSEAIEHYRTVACTQTCPSRQQDTGRIECLIDDVTKKKKHE